MTSNDNSERIQFRKGDPVVDGVKISQNFSVIIDTNTGAGSVVLDQTGTEISVASVMFPLVESNEVYQSLMQDMSVLRLCLFSYVDSMAMYAAMRALGLSREGISARTAVQHRLEEIGYVTTSPKWELSFVMSLLNKLDQVR